MGVDYEGPDRCEIVEGQGYRIIDIGNSEYAQPPGTNTWHRTLQLSSEAQCALGTILLNPLLYSNQVQRTGNRYEVEEVTPTTVNSLQIAGWWRVTLVVQDGRVVQETVTSTPTFHPDLIVNTGPAMVTYSEFGSSPPVTAPPTNDISG